MNHIKEFLQKSYFFSEKELKEFLITTALFAFMFSFKEFNYSLLGIFVNLGNYTISFLIIGMSVYFHHSAQRLTSSILEYKPEHKLWKPGLIIGMIIAILSQGRLWFFGATSFIISIPDKGRFKKLEGPNQLDFAVASLRGPLACVALAASVKTLSWIIPIHAELVEKIFQFNLWYAFFQLLPIPPLDGSRVFYASRQWYVFLISFFISYVLLFMLFNIFSFIWAFFIAFIVWFFYYTYIELSL